MKKKFHHLYYDYGKKKKCVGGMDPFRLDPFRLEGRSAPGTMSPNIVLRGGKLTARVLPVKKGPVQAKPMRNFSRVKPVNSTDWVRPRKIGSKARRPSPSYYEPNPSPFYNILITCYIF